LVEITGGPDSALRAALLASCFCFSSTHSVGASQLSLLKSRRN
jgi:hypothetical protein